MRSLVKNSERVGACLKHHYPQHVDEGWQCLGNPDSKGPSTLYVVSLGLSNAPEHLEVAMNVVKGSSEHFATAIREGAEAAKNVPPSSS